jgi:hypothetical protein
MLICCDGCGLKYDALSRRAVKYTHLDFHSEQCKEDYIDFKARASVNNLRESEQLERDIERGLVGVFG